MYKSVAETLYLLFLLIAVIVVLLTRSAPRCRDIPVVQTRHLTGLRLIKQEEWVGAFGSSTSFSCSTRCPLYPFVFPG